MTRLIAALAALAALVPTRASADPTAPQVSPHRAAREDAQQVEALRRELAPGPPPAAAGPATPATPANEVTVRDHARYGTGVVIAGTGALTAALSLLTLVFYEPPGDFDPSTGEITPGDDPVREISGVFLALSVAAIIGGIALMASSDRKVRIAPTASTAGAGLVVVGRF